MPGSSPGMTSSVYADTSLPNTPPHSRRALRPSCCKKSLTPNGGRGECRVPDAPAASCAHIGSEYAHEYSQRSHRKSPGIPARNGFNGFLRALPGDRAWLSPSPGAVYCAELERQRRGVRTTRLRRPLGCRSSATPPRPPHPAPTSVTTAKRPS